MLFVHELSCQVNERFLLNHFSYTFEPGKVYSILGPNGSGKTTLLKSLIGITPCFKGDILWKGHSLATLSRKERSQVITLVPQSPSVAFDFTVTEFVQMGLYASAASPNEFLLTQALAKVDAEHLKQRFVKTLSSGERQRVYIARALIARVPILLFDEPTANLDIRHRLDIWELIDQLKKEDKIILVANHDFSEAKKWSDEMIVLHQGQMVSHGNYRIALNESVLQEVFQLKANESD